MRFISSRRVCKCPSAGRLFFRASNRKEVHCWIRLPSMNTSTIYQRAREKRKTKVQLKKTTTWRNNKKKQLPTICEPWFELAGEVRLESRTIENHRPRSKFFFLNNISSPLVEIRTEQSDDVALKRRRGSLTQWILCIAGTSGITQTEAPTLGTLCVWVHEWR